jgi:hypothetical protein
VAISLLEIESLSRGDQQVAYVPIQSVCSLFAIQRHKKASRVLDADIVYNA